MLNFHPFRDFEYACYFDIKRHNKNSVTVVAIDGDGHFMGHVVNITPQGIYLCDGMTCRIPIVKDNKGRAIILNTDINEFQKKTKEDLPKERLE